MPRKHDYLLGGAGMMTPDGHFKPMGGGGVSPVFHDTFTDTDGTKISAHTPDVNDIGGLAGWTASFYKPEIQNNALTHDVADSQIGGAYLDGMWTPLNEWEMQATIKWTDASETVKYFLYFPDTHGSMYGDWYLRLDASGGAVTSTLMVKTNGGLTAYSKSFDLSTYASVNTWFVVTVQVYQSGTDWQIKLWIDSTLVVSSEADSANINTATNEIDDVRWTLNPPEAHNSGTGERWYLDELVIYDRAVTT